MKKISTLLILNLLLLGGLFGCGGSTPEPAEEATTSEVEVTEETETPPTAAEEEEAESVEQVEVAAPEEGWKKFEGGGASIWLPGTYDGGVPSEDLEFIATRIREINPDFEQIATMIEQNPDMFSLLAFDSEIGEQPFLTNINIISEALPSNLTIETYLDITKQQLPAQFNIVEEEFIEINSKPAVRLIIELEMAGSLVKESVYIVRGDNKAWVITCATGKEDFETRRPIFEKMANSFTIDS
ncbi:hypothetical protein Lepto7376_3833 [[Leptolyngbya] sp. PCC 7376]|uniref:hypothetical protein n=1 Tax=[Leptolyngbya] sp. PCC 7376 TaxID=111781 RepID=UPI00029EC4CC|nr:hypothetical protein [[Leptolyngbya] sp. PCC 7376]AFY39990.1 hypothetical protein Lepto7376_3833 [[Leptolyngbya] sp. PCC 7376]